VKPLDEMSGNNRPVNRIIGSTKKETKS